MLEALLECSSSQSTSKIPLQAYEDNDHWNKGNKHSSESQAPLRAVLSLEQINSYW